MTVNELVVVVKSLSTTLCLPNLYKLVCQRICTRLSNVSTTWLSTILRVEELTCIPMECTLKLNKN